MLHDANVRIALGFAFASAGSIGLARGNYLAARASLEESVAIFRPLDDR
jgi:hypothetical protein